jgi:MFS family permease
LLKLEEIYANFLNQKTTGYNDLRNIIRGNIVVLIICTSIGGIGNVALSFAPVYFTSLGGSVLQYGMVTTFATLIGMPSTIVGGTIAQRHSLKKIAVLSTSLGMCLSVGWYLSNSWTTLAILTLIGAAVPVGSTAWRQLVADATIQKNRTAQLSLYQTLTGIPSICSPLLGGYFLHTMGTIDGFRLGILIAFAMSPISLILLLKFLQEKAPNRQPIPETKSSLSKDNMKEESRDQALASLCRALAHLRDRKLSSPPESVFYLYFRDFYKNLTSLPKALIPLLAALVLVTMANSAINPYLIFYATSIAKLDSFQWGVILTLQLLSASIVRTPLGMISDKFDKRKILLLSVVMTAPVPIFLIFVRSFCGILGILLTMIVTGVNYGPTHDALQIELTPREKRPALFSICDPLRNLSSSAGTIIGAALFTVSYALPFYVFTVIEGSAAAILALAFLRKRGERKSLTPTPQ